MSFRRFPFQVSDTTPFERFNTRSQEDRNMFYDATPIRRSYWNDMDTNTSNFEESTWRNPPFRNSGSAPGSPQTGHRTSNNTSWPGGSIPIRVVHEKSTRKDSSESSKGQNCSQGNSSSVGSEPPREPRVHHIPITVEPRGDSNSSHVGNGSEEQSKATHPNAGTENVQNFAGSRHHQGAFSTKTHLNNDEGIKSTADKTSENANHQPRVCHIPIMVEPRTEQTFHSPDKTAPKKTSPFQGFPPRSNSASQPFEGPAFSTRKTESAPHLSEQKTPKKPASKASGGPHVSKVPINVGEPAHVKVNESSSGEFALDQIAKVKLEMVELKKQVEEFSGCFQDKQYRYLDEMLTQCMLKLDNIDTGGCSEVRKARKVAINEVQKYISLLESKITRKNEKSDTNNGAVAQEAEDAFDKQTDNIPVEEMGTGNQVSTASDKTQGTVPSSGVVKEKMESVETSETNVEQPGITAEEKMELSEANNEKVEMDNKSESTKFARKEKLTETKSVAEKMEVEAEETQHMEEAMEAENTSIKRSQLSPAKEPEMQAEKEAKKDLQQ